MRLRRAYNSKYGFTLIELLIGAVISGVLIAAVSGVFYGMLRAQSRAYANLEDIVPRGQAIALIKSDLENMTVPNGVMCGAVLGQTVGSGEQSADDLAFYASTGKIGDVNPWGDVQRVEYWLAPSTGQGTDTKRQLVRTVTRNLLATNLDATEEPYDPYDQFETTVLLDKMGSLKFQYFDGQSWYDYWDSAAMSNALPKAVHVRVDFPPSDMITPATAPIEIFCEVAGQRAAAPAAPAA
jgi:prepilin-type N-terminal cleavage/methylation domain-containing protein